MTMNQVTLQQGQLWGCCQHTMC